MTRLHLRLAQIMVRLGQALAGNAPPERCIESFESRAIQPKEANPNGLASFGAGDVTRTRDLLITSGILCVLRRFIVFVFA